MNFIATQITGYSSVYSSACLENFKAASLGLCEGNPPLTGGFPSHRASNAENFSISWRNYSKQRFWHMKPNIWNNTSKIMFFVIHPTLRGTRSSANKILINTDRLYRGPDHKLWIYDMKATILRTTLEGSFSKYEMVFWLKFNWSLSTIVEKNRPEQLIIWTSAGLAQSRRYASLGLVELMASYEISRRLFFAIFSTAIPLNASPVLVKVTAYKPGLNDSVLYWYVLTARLPRVNHDYRHVCIISA